MEMVLYICTVRVEKYTIPGLVSPELPMNQGVGLGNYEIYETSQLRYLARHVVILITWNKAIMRRVWLRIETIMAKTGGKPTGILVTPN
jgi:hypothetical protein